MSIVSDVLPDERSMRNSAVILFLTGLSQSRASVFESMLLWHIAEDVLITRVCPHLALGDIRRLLLSSGCPVWTQFLAHCQGALRRRLLGAAEAAQRWCWIVPASRRCEDDVNETDAGELVRLMSSGDRSATFRSYDTFVEARSTRRDIEVEYACLRLRWVGSGSAPSGTWIEGADCENDATRGPLPVSPFSVLHFVA